MEINKALFGALAFLGVAAAGGGAYMANRHNQTDMIVAAPSYGTPAAATAVTETENSIAAPIAAVETPAVAEPAPVVARPAPQRVPVAVRERPAAPRERAAAPRVEPRRAPVSSIESASAAQAPAAVADAPVAAAVEPVENTTTERIAAQELPRRTFEELVIPADSVIGLQVEQAVSSDRARVEDVVNARVTRDVRVRDQVAIPAGARAEGSVTVVERGGRLKDQARLGIRFHTIVLADGTRLPINTDTVYREGESPARESAAKIGGGAVGGAVLGAIFGGKKGAVIGSTVGAAGGSVAVAASEPNAASFPAGTTVTVRMGAPATVTVEQ